MSLSRKEEQELLKLMSDVFSHLNSHSSSALDDGGKKHLEHKTQIPFSQIGRGIDIIVECDKKECLAIAERLGILSLESLKGVFSLKMLSADRVLVKGHIEAVLEQACVITSEPVYEKIDEDFLLRFIPQFQMPHDDDIFDLEALLEDEADDVPHDGRMVDVKKALYEQLALCLNPYPRKEGSGLEKFVDYAPSEEEYSLEENSEKISKKNPFEVLKKLKDKGGNL